MIDYSRIEEYKKLDEAESSLLRAMIDIFFEQAPVLINDIKRGLSEGHLAEVFRAAHTLRGAGMTLGARELSPICEAIQDKANRQETSGFEALVGQLERVYGQTKLELETIRLAS